jgi:predicted glycosyltransferase
MKILIDVSHPALAHVFAHVVRAFAARGHSCVVVARAKDVTLALLDAYGIPYRVLTGAGHGHLGRARELVVREARLFALARRLRPDLVTGTSVHAARVARACGARSAVLNDDDAAAVPLFRWLAYPLASAIVTPTALAHERWGPRHLTYPSYHALFYLHPARFSPDPGVAGELGLAAGAPYAVVRLSALEAHHDTGVRGVSPDLLRALRERIGGSVRLFVSSEKPLPPELEGLRLPLPPARAHHALAGARFVLGDSQTMTAEAAVLGTPAFRVNDFVGRIAYLRELEDYGLAFGFRPGREADALAAIEGVLAMPDRAAVFAARRAKMLAEKIDPLPWFVGAMEALAGDAAPRAPLS